jgi:hypothetical protein
LDGLNTAKENVESQSDGRDMYLFPIDIVAVEFLRIAGI